MYKPTKRAMIDVGRKCNINCKFCYYKHLGDLRKESFTDIEELKSYVNEAKFRGNDYIDISGGEPTIYPEIVELVRHIKEKEMGCRIITNGLSQKIITPLVKAGVDEFLMSIHGIEAIHNSLTTNNSSYAKLRDFITSLIDNNIEFSFNTVINQENQHALLNMVKEFKDFKPNIWNFINFNPHYEWAQNTEASKGIVANLDTVGILLNNIIPILESQGTGVNLRYYPMCQISEDFRRCVCNDYHVSFDPYEWDNNIYPKSVETHLRWALDISDRIECKTHPCNKCDLQYVCGGINNEYYKAMSNPEIIKPLKGLGETISQEGNFYFYREQNTLAFQEAGK